MTTVTGVWLVALSVAIVIVIVLGGTLLMVLMDRRRTAYAAIAAERATLLTREQMARAEAVARAAERDAVFETMADGVVVYDAAGNILHANAAFRAQMAIDRRPDFVSLPLAERMALAMMRDEQGRPLLPEQRPQLRLLRGEVLTGAHDMDIVVRSLDGRDVQLNVSGAPTRDRQGRVVGAVAIYRDVTERRQLERRTVESLHALLAMAEALVQGEDDAGAGQDLTTGVAEVGKRLVALTRSVLGCRRVTITAVDPETRVPRPIAAIGATPEQERLWRSGQAGSGLHDFLDQAQLERLWSDGMLVVDAADLPDRALPYDIRSLLLALMRVGQRVVGVLSLDHGPVAHSYTPDELALARTVARLTALVLERDRLLRDRADAQANVLALVEANRRMDAFLALASHELKTPLTSVSGNLQIAERRLARAIADGQESRADLSPVLVRARQSLKRMDRLVDDLLDMARIQADRLQIHLERYDLIALVREVVEERRQFGPDRVIQLDLPALAHIAVRIDSERIGQVVLNFLTNALKYAPPERPIVVGIRIEGGQVCVWVRDEGPGIPVADQQRIWDRFHRVAGVQHQSGSSVGLGLGLYISRTIVERHGGQVGLESDPGAGATFWFTLPLDAEDEARES